MRSVDPYNIIVVALIAMLSLAQPSTAADPLLDSNGSNGKTADMSKPVQVFILLGQSNMLGAGRVGPKKGNPEGSLEYAVKEKHLYPYLVADDGNWNQRDDVRNVRVMGSGTGEMKVFNNEWLTVKGNNIGPELGIGHQLGNAIQSPVMILKSCIGNRSLGWDLLPPASEQYEFADMDKKTKQVKTYIYAGYKESPLRWEKGTTPEPITWYAGMQYDGDIARAKQVLVELDQYYPEAKSYEVAGFFFWQGDKDRYDAGHASRYEQNLVRFIKTLRKDFDAPNAKFVCATLGQSAIGVDGNEGLILNAQRAVDGKSGKYPEFKGNVTTVYTHPLSQGGASNSHYNGNAETYMNVGEAMGAAMVELLNHEKK